MISITMTMYDALKKVAEARLGREVFVCGNLRLTNRELLSNVDALANGLAGLGLHKGDRVAALLPPGGDFLALFFAVARLGGMIVPLNPDLSDISLGSVLSDAAPRLLVSARPLSDELLGHTPSPVDVIDAGAAGKGIPLASVLDAGSDKPRPEHAAPTDLLALLYTSGTTGTPKATMHTHSSLIAPVVASLKARELWQRPSSLRATVEVAKAVARYRRRLLRSIGRPQTIMSTMGWHSITGLHVMLQGLLMGDRLAAMSRFQPRDALELVEREKVTVLVAVPLAYQAMMSLEDLDRYDTSSLLVCASGGAACPPSLAREIHQRFRCALYNGFGMTEAAGGIAVSDLSDSDEQQAETVGRPMPGVDVRIVDEGRQDLPVGEVGELAVRGDGIMRGYYQAPELTAQVLDEERWLYTGDLATIDEKGYLRIVGRKKDIIIRGGQNIYPAEIEHFLETHGNIEEAVVVGVPTVVGGESVWAFVRLKQGVEMTTMEVLDYCRGRLELYKIPSQVRIVRELPRAEMGKSQRFRLRAMAIEETKGGGP